MTRPKHIAPRQPRVARICPICGVEFLETASRVRDGKGIYCSRRCFRADDRRRGIERFWSNVDKASSLRGCWLWTGHIVRGYGRATIDGHTTQAHRIAWELLVGPIPDGLMLCHDCPGGDNRLCVNPAHMFLGTSVDNNRDAARKGRASHGTAHQQAKLDERKVEDARRRYAAGEAVLTRLAADYGVSMAVMRDAIRGKTWRHASGPISPPKFSRRADHAKSPSP